MVREAPANAAAEAAAAASPPVPAADTATSSIEQQLQRQEEEEEKEASTADGHDGDDEAGTAGGEEAADRQQQLQQQQHPARGRAPRRKRGRKRRVVTAIEDALWPCRWCAQSKNKCEGGLPCRRCYQLSLCCVPNASFHRGTARAPSTAAAAAALASLPVPLLDLILTNSTPKEHVDLYYRAFQSVLARGLCSRARTLRVLRAWTLLGSLAGCDVTWGLAKRVATSLGIPSTEIEDPSFLALESPPGAATHARLEATRARLSARGQALPTAGDLGMGAGRAASWAADEAAGAAVVLAEYGAGGAAYGGNARFASLYRSAVQTTADVVKHRALSALLVAPLFAHEDRPEYFEVLSEALFAEGRRSSTRLVKTFSRAQDGEEDGGGVPGVGLWLLTVRSWDLPDGRFVVQHRFEPAPPSRHVTDRPHQKRTGTTFSCIKPWKQQQQPQQGSQHTAAASGGSSAADEWRRRPTDEPPAPPGLAPTAASGPSPAPPPAPAAPLAPATQGIVALPHDAPPGLAALQVARALFGAPRPHLQSLFLDGDEEGSSSRSGGGGGKAGSGGGKKREAPRGAAAQRRGGKGGGGEKGVKRPLPQPAPLPPPPPPSLASSVAGGRAAGAKRMWEQQQPPQQPPQQWPSQPPLQYGYHTSQYHHHHSQRQPYQQQYHHQQQHHQQQYQHAAPPQTSRGFAAAAAAPPCGGGLGLVPMPAATIPAALLRLQPAAGPLDAASLLEAAIHHTAMEQAEAQLESGAAEDEQRHLMWLCGDAV